MTANRNSLLFYYKIIRIKPGCAAANLDSTFAAVEECPAAY